MIGKILTVTTLILLAGTGRTQIATSIANEGDPVPGMPGFTFGSLNNPAVNGITGYAVTANVEDGVDTISLMFGSVDQLDTPAVLFMEQTFPSFAQTSWESFAGMDDLGRVAYSATGDNGLGDTSADSAWVDDFPLAIGGTPSSVAGQFWSFASRPNITPSGMPWFVGGITSTPTGSTQNRGLFVGFDATPLYLGGDVVPPFTDPLSTANTVAFDLGFSANGTHHIVEVQLANGNSSADNAIVIDGVGLSLGGTLVQEGNPVPASVGGDGVENWDNFDFMGINEAGDWFFTGDTDGDTATDEIIVFNGQILYREGDVIDGHVVSGAIEGAWLTEDGDLAFIWDINDNADEALFVNDRLVLADGDAVDLDGDGVIDPGTAISSFTGISVLRAGVDWRVYFTADIDTQGTSSTLDDIEGFFCLSVFASPKNYCTAKASSSACLASLTTSDPAALPVSGASDYSLIAVGVQGQRNGLIVSGVQGPALIPFQGGTLCVNPPLARSAVQNSGGTLGNCDGSLTVLLNDGSSSFDPGPGTTVWAQAWYRDPLLGDGFDSALSDGIAVQYL